jgi:hypothetical protein
MALFDTKFNILRRKSFAEVNGRSKRGGGGRDDALF